MNAWYDKLSFLWEEPTSRREAPEMDREEPAGVPRLLRRATHYALMGVVSTTLMAQIIGVRLISPADAQANHCAQTCQTQFQTCKSGCDSLTGAAKGACVSGCSRAQSTCNNNCGP